MIGGRDVQQEVQRKKLALSKLWRGGVSNKKSSQSSISRYRDRGAQERAQVSVTRSACKWMNPCTSMLFFNTADANLFKVTCVFE